MGSELTKRLYDLCLSGGINPEPREQDGSFVIAPSDEWLERITAAAPELGNYVMTVTDEETKRQYSWFLSIGLLKQRFEQQRLTGMVRGFTWDKLIKALGDWNANDNIDAMDLVQQLGGMVADTDKIGVMFNSMVWEHVRDGSAPCPVTGEPCPAATWDGCQEMIDTTWKFQNGCVQFRYEGHGGMIAVTLD